MAKKKANIPQKSTQGQHFGFNPDGTISVPNGYEMKLNEYGVPTYTPTKGSAQGQIPTKGPTREGAEGGMSKGPSTSSAPTGEVYQKIIDSTFVPVPTPTVVPVYVPPPPPAPPPLIPGAIMKQDSAAYNALRSFTPEQQRQTFNKNPGLELWYLYQQMNQ